MIKDRIEILQSLRKYIQQNSEEFQWVKEKAERQNGWFTQEFIEQALKTISTYYLDEVELNSFASKLKSAEDLGYQRTIGITMAGNIPLVGFHDFLTVYLSGHIQRIKFSSKDDVLLPHLIQKLYEFDEENRTLISSSEMLKNCDAYIATGSNNSALYFEKYFARFPHVIRRNRTSVAILTGNESEDQLSAFADDVYLYFGLGCRNVTKLFVPNEYDFIPLLNAFRKYDALKNHNKYRNNLDYNLAVFILNNQFYMSNESILLIENKSVYSSISVLNFEYYSTLDSVHQELNENQDIQAIVGEGYLNFGQSQTPSLSDFADGVNTIDFLNSL